MDQLDRLENRSVHLLREARAEFRELGMLWSIGKDSTVLLHLARKAFFGRVPFPLIHVDTSYKIPEMIEYRDRIARRDGLELFVHGNHDALARGDTFPAGAISRTACCEKLKTSPLKDIALGRGTRRRWNPARDAWEIVEAPRPFDAIIAGIRSDEEGTRAKERYFSLRSEANLWSIETQPLELWNRFESEMPPGAHVRVHPLLDWTEVDIWRYIERHAIEVVPLYFERGEGTRYRSLGCQPCTRPVLSTARNASEIVEELTSGRYARVAERAGRAQDTEDGGTLERLRRGGYM